MPATEPSVLVRRPAGDSESAQEHMEALVTGTLAVENDCVVLRAEESGEVYRPIWPAGTVLDPAARQVVGSDGLPRAAIEGRVEMSGGEIDAREARRLVADSSTLDACPGNYWLVGEQVRQL